MMDKVKRDQITIRILDWFGNIWLILACIFIIVGYIAIVIFRGWSKLWNIISPLDIWNFLAVVITLTPGIGLKILANRLRKSKTATDNET
jgi:hypothetical protein